MFGRGVAQRVIEYFSSPRLEAATHIFPELTEREREILTLIAEGESNPFIAKKLFLSPKTVRNHVSNIFSKLQVADRAQAIVRARRAGLTDNSGTFARSTGPMEPCGVSGRRRGAVMSCSRGLPSDQEPKTYRSPSIR